MNFLCAISNYDSKFEHASVNMLTACCLCHLAFFVVIQQHVGVNLCSIILLDDTQEKKREHISVKQINSHLMLQLHMHHLKMKHKMSIILNNNM
jgi:hypothetical protein